MSEQELLQKFSDDFLQEVIAGADSHESGEFRANEFTRQACGFLVEAGTIEDVEVCYHKAKGMQLNGYSVSQDDDCLDLFVTLFNQQSPPPAVPKLQVETACRQAVGALKKGLTGYYLSLEESTEVYDMYQRIHELRDTLSRVSVYLLTDGIVNCDTPESESEGDISISFQIWDIQRFFRFATSGRKSEAIEIDFEQTFGTTIPCLSMADPASDYKGYLAVIPGTVLAGIYDKYGPRLLERNVRSFLQARGNVNKGIRRTILEEPHRFFAYNNGISATADEIQFAVSTDGTVRISKVRNLQIVNGGQTTASLHHTAKKDKAGLQGIYVQAKLSVIPPEQIDGIVPLISRYANSQNKVNDADFFANDPFHVRIEELSRTIWAPSVDGTNRQSKWFYERARGQYLDAKGREGTSARKRQFDQTYPKSQKFDKTDLAKYENTWSQLPFQVSMGAQKNFNHFSVRLQDRGKIEVDSSYFERLIAKAILFRRAEKIVSDQSYGGYRANIVTYTLAWLSHRTAQRINLDEIWKLQGISAALQEAIRSTSVMVHRIVTNPPNGRNVTEWCKRKECWEAICSEDVDLPGEFEAQLRRNGSTTESTADKGIDGLDAQDLELIRAVTLVPAETWFTLAKWAKETNNLQSWQRSLAFSIGRLLSRGQQPSRKQAQQAIKIIAEAKELGFG